MEIKIFLADRKFKKKNWHFQKRRNNSNNSAAVDCSFIIIFIYFLVHCSLRVDNFELQMYMQADSRIWQWIGGNLAKNGIHVTSHTCNVLSRECGNHWIFEHLKFEIFWEMTSQRHIQRINSWKLGKWKDVSKTFEKAQSPWAQRMKYFKFSHFWAKINYIFHHW